MHNAMLLSIVKAKSAEGKQVDFETEVSLNTKFVEDKNYEFLNKASVKGKMVFDEGNLTINSTVKFKIMAVCDRCGEKFEKEIVFPLNETFVDITKAHNEEDYVILNQTCVDIDKAVQDALLLFLPTRMLCKENCKGLCPICGKNKNFYSCGCENIVKEEDLEENPFNILKNKN